MEQPGDVWNAERAAEYIHEFSKLNQIQKEQLIACLNETFPPSIYHETVRRLYQAIENTTKSQRILDNAEQAYPELIAVKDGQAEDLDGYGIILTAGGDGERLRLSLIKAGIDSTALADFTKATYPLENFFLDFGTLHANLSVIAEICHEQKIDIPVLVTTGPPGSVTARVIPHILKRFDNFGLKRLMVIEQESRLHLTVETKIVYKQAFERLFPVTNPDETGGPVMRLKKPLQPGGDCCLDQLIRSGCRKLILLQGTAIYDPKLIFNMAKAGQDHDALGVGITRQTFPEDDPYGTFVEIRKNDRRRLIIVEQDVRNHVTRQLMQGGDYLPYNTGLYIFDCDLLKRMNLPDYATPPKEIVPTLPRAPKVGFAATDILPLAERPAILSVSQNAYGVIKTYQDLRKVGKLGVELGIDRICKRIYRFGFGV